jgi:Zn-dependent membrane protease YugP
MEDAIHPAAQAAQIAAANKVATTAQNADRVTHVNGSRVYNVTVDTENGEIWYHLCPGSKTRYYYPIQYASITIAAVVAQPTVML